MSSGLFPFAQLDFPGALGLADGRYLVRSDGEASEVLIVSTLGAPAVRRRRRTRSRPIERGAEPEPVPLTRVTVVTPEDLGGPADAAAWLDRLAGDEDAAEAFVSAALRLVNRALHAHATAAQDPYVHEVSGSRATALRIGFGEGEQVADGQWSDARELIRGEPRRRRAESLQPQERVAAVLGGRERVEAAETLLLRARLDLDEDRPREAALQLAAGVPTLVAELSAADASRREDLEALRAREPEVERLAEAARGGDLGPQDRAAIADVVAICERALRRRRLRPQGSSST